MSARFASLVVMYREKDLHTDPFFSDIPLCRYRDNYCTLSPSAEFLSSLCTRLATALSVQVTIEAHGTEIPFLGCTPALDEQNLPTTRVKPPSFHSQPGDSTASTLQRCIHFSSPNARPTPRSCAPNMFR